MKSINNVVITLLCMTTSYACATDATQYYRKLTNSHRLGIQNVIARNPLKAVALSGAAVGFAAYNLGVLHGIKFGINTAQESFAQAIVEEPEIRIAVEELIKSGRELDRTLSKAQRKAWIDKTFAEIKEDMYKR